MNLTKNQAGYLLEIPLIVAAVVVLLAIALPALPKYPVLAKIAMVVGALIITAGLYYMIVIPGWRPDAKGLSWPYNMVLFCIIAAFIALVAIAFMLK